MRNVFSWAAAVCRGARGRLAAGGFGLIGALLLFSGCTADDGPRDNTDMLPASDRVSSVPWNKPQGWEDKGSLGALANDPRIGGQQ